MTLKELTSVLDPFEKLIVRYGETRIETVLDRGTSELDPYMGRAVNYVGTTHRGKYACLAIELE